MCYPFIFKIKGRRILFIGGGNVALRKVKPLEKAGAKITVISKRFHPSFYDLKVKRIKKRASLDDITGEYEFIFLCTDDRELNKVLSLKAKNLGIPVNVADNKSECDFYTPALIEDGDVLIAITTKGKDPKRSKNIKNKIFNFIKNLM